MHLVPCILGEAIGQVWELSANSWFEGRETRKGGGGMLWSPRAMAGRIFLFRVALGLDGNPKYPYWPILIHIA